MSKDKLIIKDNTIIELETGSDLSNLTATYNSKADMVAAWEKLTKDNLSAATIQNGDGLTVGRYTNLVLTEPNLTVTELPDGTIKAVFGLREKTATEKDIDTLKEGQEVQDGAIQELANMTGGK